MKRTMISEIEEVIIKAIAQMEKLRTQQFHGEWRDAENLPGIISTCEALFSILSPMEKIPLLKEQIFPLVDVPNIKKTIAQVISWTEEGFFGSPYIDFSADTRFEKDQDFLDSACFVFSALSYAKKVLRKQLEEQTVEQIDKRLVQALKVIDECHLGEKKGWAWGHVDKPDESFLYCCWTAAEMIEGLNENPKSILPQGANDIMDNLKEKVIYTRNWLEDTFIKNPKKGEGIQYDLTKDAIAFAPEDKSAYYNLYAVFSLLLMGSKEFQAIETGIDVIVECFNDSRRSYLRKSFEFFFDGKEILIPEEAKKYTDRAFLPLVLKVLALYVGDNTQRMNKYKDNILEFYDLLLKNRGEGIYSAVWDKYASSTPYAIYYTERAIEALLRLHSCLKHHEVVVKVPESNVEELSEVIIGDARIRVDELVDRLLDRDDFLKRLADLLKEKSEDFSQLFDDVAGLKRKVTDIEKKVKGIEKKVKGSIINNLGGRR